MNSKDKFENPLTKIRIERKSIVGHDCPCFLLIHNYILFFNVSVPQPGNPRVQEHLVRHRLPTLVFKKCQASQYAPP